MNKMISIGSGLVFTAGTLARPLSAMAYPQYVPCAEPDKQAKKTKNTKTQRHAQKASKREKNTKNTKSGKTVSPAQKVSQVAKTPFTNFILKTNPGLAQGTAKQIAANVSKYSKEQNIDPRLVLALMARESSFRSNVVSRSGAIG